MLSVCVPIYNCNVSNLVKDILTQLNQKLISSEIILIDDASEVVFQKRNKILSENEKVNYIQLAKNIGRSKIRNLFLQYNKFDYLLFLDCDSQITNPQFIENYLTQIKKNKQVICGGRSYPIVIPKKQYYLRWKYGVARECVPASRRGQKPHQSFMTNNFIVHSNLLSKIKFDERLTGYGHEDTLFGYRLKQNKQAILHINNPSQHIYTERNDEFLQKTIQGLHNLVKIRQFIDNDKFDDEVKILRVYRRLSKLGVIKLIKLSNFIFLPLLKWLVKNNIGGLYLFDVYKLLILCKLIS